MGESPRYEEVTFLSKASDKVVRGDSRTEVSQTAYVVLSNTNWIRGY